jgi:hypothetical protein
MNPKPNPKVSPLKQGPTFDESKGKPKLHLLLKQRPIFDESKA